LIFAGAWQTVLQFYRMRDKANRWPEAPLAGHVRAMRKYSTRHGRAWRR